MSWVGGCCSKYTSTFTCLLIRIILSLRLSCSVFIKLLYELKHLSFINQAIKIRHILFHQIYGIDWNLSSRNSFYFYSSVICTFFFLFSAFLLSHSTPSFSFACSFPPRQFLPTSFFLPIFRLASFYFSLFTYVFLSLLLLSFRLCHSFLLPFCIFFFFNSFSLVTAFVFQRFIQ